MNHWLTDRENGALSTATWLRTRRRPIIGILGCIGTLAGLIGCYVGYSQAWAVYAAVTVVLCWRLALECFAPSFLPPTHRPRTRDWAPLGVNSLLLTLRDRRGTVHSFYVLIPPGPSQLREAHTRAAEDSLQLESDAACEWRRTGQGVLR